MPTWRRARPDPCGLVVPNKLRATQPCAKWAPSLRVARQLARGCVAGFAKGTTIGGIPRLASHTLAQQRGSSPNVNRPERRAEDVKFAFRQVPEHRLTATPVQPHSAEE